MVTEAPSTVRARMSREPLSLGAAMIAPVEVGEGGVRLLVSNGLFEEHETRDRNSLGEACLAALEQWSMGRGARVKPPFYVPLPDRVSGTGGRMFRA